MYIDSVIDMGLLVFLDLQAQACLEPFRSVGLLPFACLERALIEKNR